LSNRPVAAKALSDELSGLGGPIRNGAAVRFPGSGDEHVSRGPPQETCKERKGGKPRMALLR